MFKESFTHKLNSDSKIIYRFSRAPGYNKLSWLQLRSCFSKGKSLGTRLVQGERDQDKNSSKRISAKRP